MSIELNKLVSFLIYIAAPLTIENFDFSDSFILDLDPYVDRYGLTLDKFVSLETSKPLPPIRIDGDLTLFGLGFCQPKKTGGGAFPPPRNFAISSQMTMKLGKDILWVEIFSN